MYILRLRIYHNLKSFILLNKTTHFVSHTSHKTKSKSSSIQSARVSRVIEISADKEIKLIDQYPDGENINPEYLLINPKGVVPSLDIDGVIVTESTVIIKKLNSLKGSKDINLWPSDISKEDLENWVDDTTLTNGVPLGASFGATIPPFSSILLNHMVQKYVSVPQASVSYTHLRAHETRGNRVWRRVR